MTLTPAPPSAAPSTVNAPPGARQDGSVVVVWSWAPSFASAAPLTEKTATAHEESEQSSRLCVRPRGQYPL